MAPLKDSLSNSTWNPISLPWPSQLFSCMLNAILPPLVPTPAPALISPVGFSSTSISMTFKLFALPSIIL